MIGKKKEKPVKVRNLFCMRINTVIYLLEDEER